MSGLTFYHTLFDRLAEPVGLLSDGKLLYSNPAFFQLFPHAAQTLPIDEEALRARMQDEDYLVLPEGSFSVTGSDTPDGTFFLLHPVPTPSGLGDSSFLPSRLRQHLSDLSASIERMSALSEAPAHQELISAQTQSLFRLLRLTQQLELLQVDLAQAYPLSTVDFSGLCRNLAEDLYAHIGTKGLSITRELDSRPMLLLGNSALLQHLVLALVSNAVKSSGLTGSMGLRLRTTNGRAILNVWDSGNGIDLDKFSHLFSPERGQKLPTPGAGAGLDLWLAHRIALYHKGSIVAGNRPEGGAEFALSLPLTSAASLTLRSDDALRNADLSPILLALSDALPSHFFSGFWGD